MGQSVRQSVAESVVCFEVVVVLDDFFVVSLVMLFVLLLCSLSAGDTRRASRCRME